MPVLQCVQAALLCHALPQVSPAADLNRLSVPPPASECQSYCVSSLIHAGGELWEDFARLARAPRLFKDSGSTFGLWAGVANQGEVWSTPIVVQRSSYGNELSDRTVYLGDRWHWVTNVTVMLPKVAHAAGIPRKESSDAPMGPERTALALKWLREN